MINSEMTGESPRFAWLKYDEKQAKSVNAVEAFWKFGDNSRCHKCIYFMVHQLELQMNRVRPSRGNFS